MRIGTLRYTIKQGLKNIVHNKMFSFASIATMAACIFLFGVFYSLMTNFTYIVEKAEEGVAVVVFFDEDATDAQLANIKTQLEQRDDVLEVKYIDAETAWEEFAKEYFGENSDAAEGFEENPLANSDNYEVYMKDIESQGELVEFAESLSGVRKVNKSDIVADALSNVNRLLAYVSGAIIFILLVVEVVVTSREGNVVLTTSRRRLYPIYSIFIIVFNFCSPCIAIFELIEFVIEKSKTLMQLNHLFS